MKVYMYFLSIILYVTYIKNYLLKISPTSNSLLLLLRDLGLLEILSNIIIGCIIGQIVRELLHLSINNSIKKPNLIISIIIIFIITFIKPIYFTFYFIPLSWWPWGVEAYFAVLSGILISLYYTKAKQK